ncbi:paired amphipathic helix [Mycena galopus ATCC 62051]|nr:paired amphipathic helix [Mycena galopus ATCC 62051]
MDEKPPLSILAAPTREFENTPPIPAPTSKFKFKPPTRENTPPAAAPAAPTIDSKFKFKFESPEPAAALSPNELDALRYLNSIKNQFPNQPEVYHRFLDVLKDFKSQVVDIAGVHQRVSSLFHGHRVLIEGFNAFSPRGYQIDIDVCENPAGPQNVPQIHMNQRPRRSPRSRYTPEKYVVKQSRNQKRNSRDRRNHTSD